MRDHLPIPETDLEEAAQGHDLYRAPGRDLQLEQAMEQAEASGWLPSDLVSEGTSKASHRRTAERRQDLYRAMQRLESTVSRASGQGDWVEKVRDALTGLAESIDRHVTEIEAPKGLFAEVIDRSPHLSANVNRLEREHEELIETTGAALEMITAEDGVEVEQVKRMALRILGKIAIHRQRGSELLFDAYNVDLSAGD